MYRLQGSASLAELVRCGQARPTHDELCVRTVRIVTPYGGISRWLMIATATATMQHRTRTRTLAEHSPSATLTPHSTQVCCLGLCSCYCHSVDRWAGDIEFISLTDTAYWTLPLQTLSINGQSISTSGAGAAIDTGTTLIAGPAAVVQQIYAQIGGQPGGSDLNGLWVYPCSVGDVTVEFNFGGKTWTMAARDFLFAQSSNNECVGAFIDLELGDGGPSWIVGDAFLKSVYSVFRWSPASVGFASRGSGGESHNSADSACIYSPVTQAIQTPEPRPTPRPGVRALGTALQLLALL